MRRKTRKEKESTQRRYALQCEKKQKIAKLKNEIIDYKELIKRGRIKNFKIYTKRSFKTMKSFVLSTLPFTITFAIISGISFLANSGLPFVRDDLKNYNYIDGSMDSLGNYSISSEYELSSDNDKYCNVNVFSSWEKQEDQTYCRDVYKYEFDSSDINMNDMKEYIAKTDYKSISKLSDKEVISHEVSESLSQNEINDKYFIEGKFYYRDGDDSIVVTESVSFNVMITLITLFFSGLMEFAVWGFSDGELFYGLSDSVSYGYDSIEDIKQLKLDLKRKEEELEQAKGGNLSGSKRR